MKLKLPRLRRQPYSPDKLESIIRETGFLLFFIMFGAGLYLINLSLCLIVCGLMGLWFCYPRGGVM